jgi:xanthine dehydrogenase accessory factor
MWDWISALAALQRNAAPAVLVTVCRTTGSTPRETGAKMIVLGDGRVMGTIGGGQVEHQAISDARQCLERQAGGLFEYPLTVTTGQCCGGTMELLMEILNTNPQLYIYGGGHVGQALCRILENTVFVPHLIDTRAEWISHPDLPASVIRHHTTWQEFNESASWHSNMIYAAVMTPEHAEDLEIVADLLKRPLRYLGLIGSQAKWSRFQRSLKEMGYEAAQINAVRCPIGAGNTGKAPAEIAISIAAEILKEYHATR